MGRCIISIGSGGGAIDTDELTALPENVEVGKIAGVLGHDEPEQGTLRNISNDSDILYSSDSTMHVVEGSNAYVSANSDGIPRAQIKFHGVRGVIEDNTIIGVPQNDMATAGGLNASKLLAGQSAFGINGTATNDANFGDGDLLIGKTAYKNGSKRTGTMPNRGAVASSLNCGGSYTIPAGYHNGSGKITANSLASQTPASATSNNLMLGKTAWTNGVQITGTMSVQSILSFSVAPYSGTKFTCTWKNPVRGPFSGVIIIGKTNGYPTSINDGTRFYKGSGNNVSANGVSSVVVDGFSTNTQYYLRAYAYAIKNNAEWIGNSLTATAKTIMGQEIFTESGIFTVPADVKSIDIFCVGGGGGGGTPTGSGLSTHAASGGGGGYTATKIGYTVTPGQTFAITIGAGGNQGSGGGITAFSNILTAAGGDGGGAASGVRGPGGDGGSGGGAGNPDNKTKSGAAGGSNGSDGGSKYDSWTEGDDTYSATKPGGKGQGSTTRAFANSSETLYSGGGGGGEGGAGGAGGGGAAGAGHRNSVGLDQVPIICPGKAGGTNTGGGGGAGGWHYTHSGIMNNYSGGPGGSGICIVRWGY